MQIMGILNVTPDSFSDGGLFTDLQTALTRARQMIAEGADIIDIGGESSRPGAEPVSAEEEAKRVLPIIQGLSLSLRGALATRQSICISIDTTKAVVAAKACAAGATIINDISAGRFDPKMFSIAKEFGARICLMHMQGEPHSMQKNPSYENVVEEVKEFLRERAAAAMDAGISKDKIVIDPGIGFGKRLEDNIALLKNLNQFKELGFPILIGTSRKSLIGQLTGAPVANRLAGSLATLAVAAQKGAQLCRVHDIAATKQFLTLFHALTGV
ncbi:MAG: dihydropteroate synthase [Deltaproteobacteria bacterium]|nr:dihydropteroate synthase [Deltaproteobacteria bacterium]